MHPYPTLLKWKKKFSTVVILPYDIQKNTPQNRYGKLDQGIQTHLSCVPAVHFVKYLQQLQCQKLWIKL